MTSSTQLIDPKGNTHHADELIALKSKFMAPFGLVEASFNKDGPNLAVQRKHVLGGNIRAASPKLEDFEITYTKDVPVSDGAANVTAQLGLAMPWPKLFQLDYVSLMPKAKVQYVQGKILSTALTARITPKGETEIALDASTSCRFDVAPGVKAHAKAEVKQTSLATAAGLSPNYPTTSLGLILQHKMREYGLTFNSKKNRVSMFSASFLPPVLKMHPVVNAFVPTAVGFKVDMPVEKLGLPQKWSRAMLASFAVTGDRSKNAPMALNLNFKDDGETTATLLRRDSLLGGNGSFSCVYSLSVKANLRHELGISSKSKENAGDSSKSSGGYSGPRWGFKVDMVGDMSEYPLTNTLLGQEMAL